MARKRRSRLCPEAFVLPDDVHILGPRWVAALTIYWRTQPGDSARAILDQIEQAMYETTPERSVYQLQNALRRLGLLELQIIRLVLTEYHSFVRLNAAYPAQQVAAEVLATLLAIEAGRKKPVH